MRSVVRRKDFAPAMLPAGPRFDGLESPGNRSMAVFIEFLAGSGLAIFFHWVLHYPEAAYTIFGVGILLSLATYMLRVEVEDTREKLSARYYQAHEITFSIAQIADPECQTKAQEIIAGAKTTIDLLQRGYIPMDESEFYLEGARLSEHALRQIKAVDPMTHSWGTRGAHYNFYQANLRAVERGIRLLRIFVIEREDLADPEVQNVLLAHQRDGIDIRLAYREELPSPSDASSHTTIGSFHFAIYDDQVATEAYDKPAKYFGQKTAQPAEIAKYLHMFDLIEHGSHPVVLENEQIVPASDTLQPAT